MTAFDTARDIRLPGLVIGRVYIDPKQLSTRMKNNIKKMLRAGYTDGGWRSDARKLAIKIAQARSLVLIDRGLRGFYAPDTSGLAAEVLERVVAVIDADEALELMDDRRRANSMNPNYIESLMQRTREYHEQNRMVIRERSRGGFWLRFFEAELAKQACGLLTSNRPEPMLKAIEAVCTQLDNGEPIEITIDRS